MGEGRPSGLVGSGLVGSKFCRQSWVGSGQRFAGSGPRKVIRGQLWAKAKDLSFKAKAKDMTFYQGKGNEIWFLRTSKTTFGISRPNDCLNDSIDRIKIRHALVCSLGEMNHFD